MRLDDWTDGATRRERATRLERLHGRRRLKVRGRPERARTGESDKMRGRLEGREDN